MAPFLLAGVDIYNQLITSESAFLVELAKAQFESVDWLASLENKVTKEEVLSEVFNNGLSNTSCRQATIIGYLQFREKSNVICVFSASWASKHGIKVFFQHLCRWASKTRKPCGPKRAC